MADIVLTKHTRTDTSLWYSVSNDGTVVYTSEDLAAATRYYNRLVESVEDQDEASTLALKTHTISATP